MQISASEIETRNPDGVESKYCNNIQLSTTNWDMRFLCTEIVPQPDGTVVQFVRANVVMAVSHAEALLKTLEMTLSELRKQQAISGQSTTKQ